jgi:hypothetical protein
MRRGAAPAGRSRRAEIDVVRLVVAVAVVAAALAVATVVRGRRRADAPTQVRHQLPEQLDRRDFPRPDAPWLVVVFSSATCSTCADVVRKARVLESPEVAVVEISYQEHRDVHQRYSIDAVPGLVVADREGVVAASFLGPVSATDLWAAVAGARGGDAPHC